MTPIMAQHRVAVAFAAQAVHDAQHALEAAFNTQNPDRIAEAAKVVEDCTFALDRALHNTRLLAERLSDERWEVEYGRQFGLSKQAAAVVSSSVTL